MSGLTVSGNPYTVKKKHSSAAMNGPYTCLWYNNEAQQAAEFYCSLFEHSEHLGGNGFMALFRLNGQQYMAMNGGPTYHLNPAVSLVVECANQQEIDHYWATLSEGGNPGRCGWLTDKFGLSWQIIPSVLGRLMTNPKTAPRTQKALMRMTKIEIDDLYKD
ncbi:VOC family protein [Roseivirga thermotolerans]|uniref:VOC family protein n=1 Tax=Roseivirga thermotolerans TaxID=1758176 RepID=UPI00273E6680|nr:VOC family protein [Roseivirga thermotolerans]